MNNNYITMDKIKIFYAHSTHNDNVETMYDNVCDKLDPKKFEILDIDDEHTNSNVLERMKNMIDKCDLFICDVTSDVPIINDNKYSVVNSNVMIELGYAFAKNKEIIYVLNVDANGQKIPSFLEGLHCTQYFKELDEVFILDEINNRLPIIFENCIVPKNGWETVNYNISNKLISMLVNLLDIQCIKEFIVRINKKDKKVGILFVPTSKTTKCRWININTRELFLNKNTIDLTMFGEIDKELKHLELLAHMVWFQ